MNKSVDMKVCRWEMYKFAVRWVLAAGTCGALGILVLNTLFGLELAHSVEHWIAMIAGLFLITAGRAFGTYEGP